jgi:SAM-dependent methyltransferase
VGPDWAAGDYGDTARALEPVSHLVAERVGIGPGLRVLDVGCGTGNAALAAARAGADVTAIDPSQGLLERARRRAQDEGLPITFLEGDAENLPVAGEFDVVMSVFAAIFAPDPSRTASELLRTTRPGGLTALTAWRREGAIDAVGRLLLDLVPAGDLPPRNWDDPDWATSLLLDQGASQVEIDHEKLVFEGESPEAWFADLERLHPVWLWVKSIVSEEQWDQLRGDSVAVLHDGNEDAHAFAATSSYIVIRATR